MKNWKELTLLMLLLSGLVVGCSDSGTVPDPDPVNTNDEAKAITLKVNKFIEDAMTDIYLWYNELPNIDYRSETDSKAYFDKLLYEEDKWSYITDDVVALENSFQGKEKSYGWSLSFGLFSNTGNVFALVEYVYPNTPADAAGIKRGDILVLMNNADITQENYRDLLYGDNLSVTLGVLGTDGISTGATVDLSAMELNLNPVVKTSVVEQDGHKIGYIFYAQYIANYNTAIDTAIQGLIDQNVTDLVIDLRYNPGGTITAAQHLCSAVAPLPVVNESSKLVTYQWNDKYQNYWLSNQINDQIEVDFDKDVPSKMGLDQVYILTGSGTASASELTITGLKPYMNVTTVGDTTFGKYTASITLKPEDFYDDSNYYNDFANWGLQPIVLRYANASGVTDFKDGFAPDIPADDDLFATFPLGDKNDPLFAAAIEDITGTPVVTAMKSARKPNFSYKIFDRGFSKYDINKREMLIDGDVRKMIRQP